MKLKNLFFVAFAALGLVTTSCSDDDDDPVVGIVSATLTPAGSAVSYHYTGTSANTLTGDSIAWDVTDGQLQSAVITVVGTTDATVSIGGTVVPASGLTVDATQPITITATNGNRSVVYTLTPVRANVSADGLVAKASTFSGLPTGLAYIDVAVFNNKFYAFTVSTAVTDAEAGTTSEAYQLFSSENGLNWTEVAYTVDSTDVIGGEGARLAVLGGKLYLLGGARTLGTDKYGNEAETTWGWTGPAAAINKWRGFVTSDGTNWQSLESTVSIDNGGTAVSAAMLPNYNTPYAQLATLGSTLYQAGGYMFAFGMAQATRRILSTTDGTHWTVLAPVDQEGSSLSFGALGGSLFALNGKLWLIGGVSSFVSASQIVKPVFSSTDGTTWTQEADSLTGIKNIFQAKVVSNGEVAYLFGGEVIGDDGTTTLNNSVYRSTNGTTWTEVTVPATFAGTRLAAGVVNSGAAWFFGGYSAAHSGYYGYPTGIGAVDALGTTTWNVALK